MSLSASALLESKNRLKSASRSVPSSVPPSVASRSVAATTLEYKELVDRLNTTSHGYSYSELTDFCNLDHWYPLIHDYTPESNWIPLSLDQANVMRKCYEQWIEWQRTSKMKQWNINDNADADVAAVVDKTNKEANSSSLSIVPLLSVLDETTKVQYQTLVDYVKREMDTIRTHNPAYSASPMVFIKCSSRSAKNTVLQRDSFHRQCIIELEQLKQEWKRLKAQLQAQAQKQDTVENTVQPNGDVPQDLDQPPEIEWLNMKFAALIRAGTLGLQFSTDSPHEIMEILCKSERVYEDFESALELHRSNPMKYPWTQSICMRRWVNVDPILEFRCFVCNGELRAISQYNHMVYSPTIDRFQSEIRASISHVFEQIQGILSSDPQHRWPSYVLDIGFCQATESECTAELNGQWIRKPFIIELNPYYFTTDGCMFQWNDRSDCDILTLNQEEYVRKFGQHYRPMRIRREIPTIAMDSLLPQWREVLTKL